MTLEIDRLTADDLDAARRLSTPFARPRDVFRRPRRRRSRRHEHAGHVRRRRRVNRHDPRRRSAPMPGLRQCDLRTRRRRSGSGRRSRDTTNRTIRVASSRRPARSRRRSASATSPFASTIPRSPSRPSVRPRRNWSPSTNRRTPSVRTAPSTGCSRMAGRSFFWASTTPRTPQSTLPNGSPAFRIVTRRLGSRRAWTTRSRRSK